MQLSNLPNYKYLIPHSTTFIPNLDSTNINLYIDKYLNTNINFKTYANMAIASAVTSYANLHITIFI